MHISRSRRLGIAMSFAAVAAALIVGSAQAHVLKDFGPYSVALGWVHEPTYVGQLNAVQVVVKDAKGKPVTDIGDGDLKVVVSVGGQDSAALDLVPTYDEDTGLGIPGDYEAPLVPTVPGDYTFHLTGKIHDTTVDETATSSDSTFDSAVDETAIQFPAKLPSLTEITTRLDRLDARVAAVASASPPAAVASAAPDTSAIDAANAAARLGADARRAGPRLGLDGAPGGRRARRSRDHHRWRGPVRRRPAAVRPGRPRRSDAASSGGASRPASRWSWRSSRPVPSRLIPCRSHRTRVRVRTSRPRRPP